MDPEDLSKYGIPTDKGTGVFNGDMGIIREINEYAENLTVEFDEGKMVEYSFKQLEELELAYAITIHKSQGSEYPAVIIPMYSGPLMISFPQHLHTGPRTQDNFFTHPGQIRLPFGMTIWPQTGQRRGNNRSSIIFIRKFIYSPYRQS